MTTRRLLIGAGALVVMIAVFVLAFGPNDEQRIRYQLARLGAAVAVTEPAANPLVILGHVQGELSEIFDDEVRLSVPELPGLPTRRAEIARMYVETSQRWRTATVSFDDVVVKLDDAKRSAIVTATAHVKATQHQGAAVDDHRAVNLRFDKDDGSWRVTSMTVWAAGDTREP